MMPSAQFGLDQKTISAIRAVFDRCKRVQNVVLYGSRAKGNYRQGSDIDLVIVAPELNTEDLLKFENELEDLMLPYKIDLSLQHHIDNKNLLEHIHRVGREFLPGVHK